MAEKASLNRRQSIGRWGEGLAARYLERKGYQVLDHNVSTPYGEIDLVVRQGDQIVFVEVKARTNQAYGLPETSITSRKQVHMIQSAQAYLMLHSEMGDDWRIDVICIQGKPEETDPEIVHFENAVAY